MYRHLKKNFSLEDSLVGPTPQGHGKLRVDFETAIDDAGATWFLTCKESN